MQNTILPEARKIENKINVNIVNPDNNPHKTSNLQSN